MVRFFSVAILIAMASYVPPDILFIKLPLHRGLTCCRCAGSCQGRTIPEQLGLPRCLEVVRSAEYPVATLPILQQLAAVLSPSLPVPQRLAV